MSDNGATGTTTAIEAIRSDPARRTVSPDGVPGAMINVLTPTHIETAFSDDFEVRPEACAQLQRLLAAVPLNTTNALAQFVASGDEHQQRVITANDQTVRLVAPAGSGKTQTVVHRVLSRIRDGVAPTRIVVLTFDNAAASSLRSNLKEELVRLSADVKGLTISTLNAYGYGLLRDFFAAEWHPIVPDWRPRRLVRECRAKLKEVSPERVAALPGNLEDRFFVAVFSVFKNQIFDSREVPAQVIADLLLARAKEMPFFETGMRPVDIKKVIQAVIWLYQRYDARLREEKVIDFDDQKLRAFLCLRDAPAVLATLQNRYTEVIVDEFQDINRLDFEFIKAIAAKATLVVTGYDDQAIYGFRGCTPDYIIDLEQHVGRPVAAYELRINYRCPPNIVAHADALISHNTRRIPKTPIAHQTTPSQVKVVSSLGAAAESQLIVQMIRRLRTSNPTLEWSDFAVLYRTNAQSLAPQVDFVLGDIPYHVRSEDNILANEALEKLLGALRTQMALKDEREPTPRDALLATQAYFRFLTGEDVQRATNLFAHMDDFRALTASPAFAQAVPRSGSSNFVAAIEELVDAPTLMSALDVLSAQFKGLRAMIGSLEDVLDEKVPLGEVHEIASNFSGNTLEFVRTLEGALARSRATGAGKNEHGVALRTYFRAKGLQCHTVFLIGCNDGLIPHARSLDDQHKLEEERRLFYVALTRASANLVVSYVKNVAQREARAESFPSRGRSAVSSSYYRACRSCGRRIQLRKMPRGQWVAFEGFDREHDCARPPANRSSQSAGERHFGVSPASSSSDPDFVDISVPGDARVAGEAARSRRSPPASRHLRVPTSVPSASTRRSTNWNTWGSAAFWIVLGITAVALFNHR